MTPEVFWFLMWLDLVGERDSEENDIFTSSSFLPLSPSSPPFLLQQKSLPNPHGSVNMVLYIPIAPWSLHLIGKRKIAGDQGIIATFFLSSMDFPLKLLSVGEENQPTITSLQENWQSRLHLCKQFSETQHFPHCSLLMIKPCKPQMDSNHAQPQRQPHC